MGVGEYLNHMAIARKETVLSVEGLSFETFLQRLGVLDKEAISEGFQGWNERSDVGGQQLCHIQ